MASSRIYAYKNVSYSMRLSKSFYDSLREGTLGFDDISHDGGFEPVSPSSTLRSSKPTTDTLSDYPVELQ